MRERKCFTEQQAFGPGWMEAESAAALSVVVDEVAVLQDGVGKEAKPGALPLDCCPVLGFNVHL